MLIPVFPVQQVQCALGRIEHKLDTLLELLGDSDSKILGAMALLKKKTDTLAAAVVAAGGSVQPSSLSLQEALPMANTTVDAVLAQVTETDNVIDSATNLVNGFHDVVDAAVKKALDGGATAEDLAPVTDALAGIKQRTDALAQAVAANTPAQPTSPSAPQAAQRPTKKS